MDDIDRIEREPGPEANARTLLRRLQVGRVSLAIGAAIALSTLVVGLGGAQDVPRPLRTAGQSCSDYPEGEMCAGDRLCVDVTPFGSVCSSYCASDQDCTLVGYSCRMSREPTGKVVGICTPRRLGIPEAEPQGVGE